MSSVVTVAALVLLAVTTLPAHAPVQEPGCTASAEAGCAEDDAARGNSTDQSSTTPPEPESHPDPAEAITGRPSPPEPASAELPRTGGTSGMALLAALAVLVGVVILIGESVTRGRLKRAR